MAKFKNITAGPKGVHSVDGRLLFIEPGTTEEIEVTEGELKSAKNTEWFEVSGGAAKAADAKP